MDAGHDLCGFAPVQLQPDFASVFMQLPSPYMILDRDLRYVAANDAYCAVTERQRAELIGRQIFDLFPNPAESGRLLQRSFEQVLETGKPHSIPLIEYPIQLPVTLGRGFEMRYWSCVHTPLLGPDGRTAFIVQNTVDVTDLQRLKMMAYGAGTGGVEPSEVQLLQRTQEVQALNDALTRETRGLRDLFMQAPGFIAVLVGQELRYALVNNAYQQLIGHRQVIGRSLEEALPELTDQGFARLLRTVMARREPYRGESVSVRLQRAPGADLEERFVDFVYQPVFDPNGEAFAVFVEGSDITERVHAERQRKLLVDELNHRVKNTLATVQSIASQTLRANPDPATFRPAFESRLQALSATHDLLTATAWSTASLRDLLLAELQPYPEPRYRLGGPDVGLNPAAAVAMGLVIHELATNAAKYGALSSPDGRVEVVWRLDDQVLELDWREADGPAVVAPSRRGFGSRLIERSLQGQLRGQATLTFAPGGVSCSVRLPLGDDA